MMRQILTLAVIVFVLTGCESTKYALRETIGDQEQQRIYGTFQDKKIDPSASVAANADDWTKKHLW